MNPLDLDNLRQRLTTLYSTTDRPSVDPELMIVGHGFGIRSEQRLREEIHLNLVYRVFCRPGWEGEVPDHSTFSENRHGRIRDGDALRIVFDDVVRRCVAEGLVRGEGFAIDASTIRADARRPRGVSGSEDFDRRDPAFAERPVKQYLAALDRCPIGKVLRPRQRYYKNLPSWVIKDNTITPTTGKADCGDRPLKCQCGPSTPIRKIRRSIHEDARDAARRISETQDCRQSWRERKNSRCYSLISNASCDWTACSCGE